jgi:hypothetical protein
MGESEKKTLRLGENFNGKKVFTKGYLILPHAHH